MPLKSRGGWRGNWQNLPSNLGETALFDECSDQQRIAFHQTGNNPNLFFDAQLIHTHNMLEQSRFVNGKLTISQKC
jgi:hypothetical protein